MRISRFIGIVALTLFSPVWAQAYFSTLDTADVLHEGQYQLGLEPQYIFDAIPGVNAIAHFDTGIGDGTSARFVLGSGTTTFQAGGFFKFVPIPDYQSQPGIGFFTGVLYANINGVSVLSFRVHPLISKGFQTLQSGLFTPYLSIPFGLSFASGQGTWPVQLEGGVKWIPPSMRHLSFWAEAGIEINAAFSYVSLGLSVPFDSWDKINFD